MTPKADPLVFTTADWRVLDSLQARNLSALKGITDDMNKQIIRELSDGINAGEGIPDLSKRLQDTVGMSKKRADTIARTETINASVDGARVRYEQRGITQFQFIAASDSRTCEKCSACDGKVYDLTDNAHLPPLHPNCRCAIKAVLPDRSRKKTIRETRRTAPQEPPTAQNTTFTTSERDALKNYQDLGNKQHEWECDIPADEPHKDCYVINKGLRDPAYRDRMSSADYAVFITLTLALDSALSKSRVTRDTLVIKGLTDTSFLRGKKAGDVIMDGAYGSFATDGASALDYAGVQKDGTRVFLVSTVKKGGYGVYMGDREHELLLPRGRRYVIDTIEEYENNPLTGGGKAIVYHIIET